MFFSSWSRKTKLLALGSLGLVVFGVPGSFLAGVFVGSFLTSEQSGRTVVDITGLVPSGRSPDLISRCLEFGGNPEQVHSLFVSIGESGPVAYRPLDSLKDNSWDGCLLGKDEAKELSMFSMVDLSRSICHVYVKGVRHDTSTIALIGVFAEDADIYDVCLAEK